MKTISTKDATTPALVPKLRFPEFRGAEAWDAGFLGDICQPQQWATISSTDLVNEGYPVYGANGFIGYYSDFNHEVETIAVTCRGSTCGEVSLIPPKSYITGNSMCLDEVDAAVNSYHFVYHLLTHRGFNDIISGSAQPQIVGHAIKRLGIALPKKAEQNKLAECLSSVDELMAAQARKVDALKTHKKGLMQQLFPREGETQPRLRFPEFQNAGEWEEEKLDDLLHFQDGFAFKSTDFVKAQEDATQVIRITDINNKNTNEDKVYVPTAFLERNKLGKYSVDDGDLLLSLTGAAGFNFFFWNGGPATINQRTAKVTPKIKSGHALLGLLEPLIHEKINQRGEGQNNNLSKEFLSTIVLRVPGPDEQQRIATCLSSLDALITAETQKHEALKTHKKGLMQQLFPSPEEVEA